MQRQKYQFICPICKVSHVSDRVTKLFCGNCEQSIGTATKMLRRFYLPKRR